MSPMDATTPPSDPAIVQALLARIRTFVDQQTERTAEITELKEAVQGLNGTLPAEEDTRLYEIGLELESMEEAVGTIRYHLRKLEK